MKKKQLNLSRYPSIDGPSINELDEPCLAFHKYDGSNLQFAWRQNDGWYQYGTRRRLITAKNPLFGNAIELFQNKYADGILKTLRKHKEYRQVREVVAYCEFFGASTFSGLHKDGEQRQLKLFDLYLPEQGFVIPRDFVQHFNHLDIAEVIYEGTLTKEFISAVREGKYSVKEGVVAKGVSTKRRRKGKTEIETWMVKIKTKAWLEELHRRSAESPDLVQEYEENRQQQAAFSQDENPN